MSDPLLIETTCGRVRGMARDGVRLWRGIPYAAVPARFQPPVPAAPWGGEHDATKYGPVAIQSRDPRIAMMSGVTDTIPMSEDCLSLNIFAPADTALHPVVVWIHGGAFVMGSGSTPLYDGRSFAVRHGIVVVTFNYRLGLLGFLGGNFALQDQVAALAWVKDNIAAFGGDPQRVTVMGESAGASSVAALLVMPSARGLFQRAILQSCAIGMTVPTRADADALVQRVALPANASIDAVLAAQTGVVLERGLSAFAPFVDGVLIPKPPLDAIRAGESAQVPLLLGTCRDEWSLFDVFLGPGAGLGLQGPLRAVLGDRLDALLAAYGGAWTELIGDLVFRIPTIRIAEAQPTPSYLFRFDWRSPAMGGALGAAHAMELPFVWNKLDFPASQILIGGDTAGAQPLATAMHDTWAAFIQTGDPNGAGLPTWPVYDVRRSTMLLDRSPALVDDPDGDRRAQWDGLF
ncbi:carboxylesterase/lipase family protein [soil metagenome]